MALACDLRIMAEEAEIGLPEITHKLVPVGGGTRRLPRLIGSARAFEMVYLGAPRSGSEAEAAGLVNSAVFGSELVSTVSEFASNIASHDRRALIAAKRLITQSHAIPTEAAMDLELDALLELTEHRGAISDGPL